jgi:hypothetical protein
MSKDLKSSLALVTGLLVAAPLLGQSAAAPPSPAAAVKDACDVVGGLAAFNTLGIVQLHIRREEVTQDGKVARTEKALFFLAPGPTPGRTEDPGLNVIAGDDGNGGWAVVHGKPDPRPSTIYMVKRLLTTDLFPLLLPFSLTWPGVTVTEVVPADIAGEPVWQLKVQMSHTFFHTPQISTVWTVDFDRRTYALVRAESQATDLGKGLTADGMRFSWGESVAVGGLQLSGYQRIVGLDEIGQEKSHSRIDHITYQTLPLTEAQKLFANPIPPKERPHFPIMQPPAPPPNRPGG